jgi:hypothetical protein
MDRAAEPGADGTVFLLIGLDRGKIFALLSQSIFDLYDHFRFHGGVLT